MADENGFWETFGKPGLQLAGIGGVAMAPMILDWISGASKGVDKSLQARNNALLNMANQLRGEAGTQASDSVYFKSALSALNQQNARQMNALNQQGISKGSTMEGTLGQQAILNQGTNQAMLGALSKADVNRQNLLDKANNAIMALHQGNIQTASGKMDNMNKLGSSFTSSIMPYLLDSLTKKN